MSSLFDLQYDVLANITKARRNFKKAPKDRISISYVETRLEILETLWSSFYSTHRKLIEECTKSDFEQSEYHTQDLYSSTEDLYIEFKCSLKDIISELKTRNTAQVESNSVFQNVSNVKLPKIELPVFSGQYTEWTSFYNLFKSLIHNNKTLDEVQKLHYLKTHLSGEADQLLRHIPISGENYILCWSKLESRYNNKKYLASCILSRFMNQKSISVESSSALKELLDTSNECLNALKQLGINVTEWDIIVIYILSLKLDMETRKQWELACSSSSQDLPTWDLFQEFLENRFRALEFLNTRVSCNKTVIRNSNNNIKALYVATALSCPFCTENHKLHTCQKFCGNDVDTRRNFVQSQGLCFNCLGPRHSVIVCRVPTRCQICSRKHHSLLHSNTFSKSVDKTNDSEPSTSAEAVSSEATQGDSNEVVVSCFSKNHNQVLLATALVNVQARTGIYLTFRSMLDQGSQASFITESAVQLLGLKKIANKSNVSVLGSDSSPAVVSKYIVFVKLQSLLDSNVIVRVKAHVLDKLTNYLPSKKIAVQLCLEITQLSLADPTFDTPNKIDLLLSAKVYSQIIIQGLIKDPSNFIIAQNTSFGWVISGETGTNNNEGLITCNVNISMHIQIQEDNILRRFWELESEPSPVKSKKHLTEEEQKCEEIYTNTTKRDSSGRYIVKLPFKTYSPQCLMGNSKDIALKRLCSLERKLNKDSLNT